MHNNIEELLKHSSQHKNVVISWSVNPQRFIEKEEHKCSPLQDRLDAAKTCADHGFPIGLHLDPLLYFDDWQNEYSKLIDLIAKTLRPEQIAWISLGSIPALSIAPTDACSVISEILSSSLPYFVLPPPKTQTLSLSTKIC